MIYLVLLVYIYPLKNKIYAIYIVYYESGEELSFRGSGLWELMCIWQYSKPAVCRIQKSPKTCYLISTAHLGVQIHTFLME